VRPETAYTKLGEQRIAYQVFGSGPPDLLLTAGSFGHTDVLWDEPSAALFMRRLGSFCRVIRFDHRGTANSDPMPPEGLPLWESHGLEVEAVLDAAGSERAVILAGAGGGPGAVLFATTRPSRTAGLILYNSAAKFIASSDFPLGIAPEAADAMVSMYEQAWGTGALAALLAPSRADDERFRSWYARFERAIGTPTVVHHLLQPMLSLDVRPFLSAVTAPTLVLHRRGYQMLTLDHARYLAEHIPGARLVELPGNDGGLFWEEPDFTLDAVREFVSGNGSPAPPERVLATVLFTDIVGSTERLRQLGDREWSEVVRIHDEVGAHIVAAYQGRLVETTGDGIFATFDGPGRAIAGAVELRHELSALAIEIRAGLHTGEVELIEGRVRGLSVHLANRIMSLAGAGEVLISRTVRDLISGSGIGLEDRGFHQLKGIEEPWQVYAVTTG
jgi:class 3 adenylate cyclase